MCQHVEFQVARSVLSPPVDVSPMWDAMYYDDLLFLKNPANDSVVTATGHSQTFELAKQGRDRVSHHPVHVEDDRPTQAGVDHHPFPLYPKQLAHSLIPVAATPWMK
jgi:hypothetical protein